MKLKTRKTLNDIKFYLILILLCAIIGILTNIIYNPGARQLAPIKSIESQEPTSQADKPVSRTKSDP